MKEKIKTQKTKSIIVGILIGIVAFPTIAIGGSFVVSLIQGKSVEEAVQILAEQIDSLIGRVEIIETKQAEIETKQLEQEQTSKQLQEQLIKEKACKKADKLFDQAEYVYSQGSHRVITALTVEDFISETEKMLQEYQWLANDQNLLCPPTPEGVTTYCTTGNDHLSFHNHIYDYSVSQNERAKSSHNLLLVCVVDPSDPSQSWWNNIDKIIQGLEYYCEGIKNGREVDMTKELSEQKNKLAQLQQLNTEYLSLKKECEAR